MRVDGGEPWLWYVDHEGKPRRVKQSFSSRTLAYGQGSIAP
jgi:hypothetical protein